MPGKESYFTASDGAKIFVFTAEPADKARAVLHVHHGLAEHSGRYRRLAEALVLEGIAVVVHDVRGHGKTAEAAELGLGRVPSGPEGAVPRWAADLAELIAASRASMPSTPVFLLGHSGGTVVSQYCVGKGLAKVDGMLLSAPPARVPAMQRPFLRALLGFLHKVHGTHGVSKIPAKVTFDKFQKNALAAAGGGPRDKLTGFEWLSRDAAEVDKYLADPYCGHDLSIGFWVSFNQVLNSLQDPATLAALPADLPLCIFVGEHDFCSVDDSGVTSFTSVQRELLKAGKGGPKVVVYPRARHELLNEECREEVAEDIALFLKRCVARPPPSSRL